MVVGLKIVLETLKNSENTKSNRIVINKPTVTMIKTSSPASDFLKQCFLCKQKLSTGKDIYMYKGDGAFCSVECRSHQILMDEEETKNNSKASRERDKCYLAAIKGAKLSPSSSSSSSSSMHNQKGATNRNGANCFVF